ncbi:hypothetical protein Taro_026878 [Colocasia esculenta]|uniref:SET domain-containing protein n=1 Tax=Colocasia esculenta TaxID=4460 RepID=A0A843VE36_COLES|nr:hypothetical protein [Colocasia esculenta]
MPRGPKKRRRLEQHYNYWKRKPEAEVEQPKPATAMEMRACEETGMSRDLTPPIRPFAASLHDSFLLSHCSSCFLPVPVVLHGRSPDPRSPPCCRCGAALRYCSSGCRDADVDAHASSGECQLLLLVRLHRSSRLSAWREGDTADLRAAVRLAYSFEKLGLLPAPRSGLRRIGGLLAGDRGELEEGSEMRERIREGGALMYRARKLLRCDADGGCESGEGGGDVEEAVLWAVVTNAVEVQVGEGLAIGIAVYGPRFSWFNHSCSPNACYRFELLGSECFRSSGSRLLVHPTATGSEDGMVTTWALDEKEQNQGGTLPQSWLLDGKGRFCRFGPRIVVRSIRPIKQGEEVCITYTDLLQPLALRRSDLWSKYGFICCCKRCTAIPEMYVDHILSETAFSLDTANLNPCHGHPQDEETEELADILNQAVTEYLSTGGPVACCSYIENILSKGFRGEWLQLVESSPTRFKLQPLHHISLKAYIILASMYRIRGCDLQTSNLGRDGVPEVFDMNRAAAAYSLLLAGATNLLFLSDPSLIATTALFWISAGRSFLGLVRSLLHGPQAKLVNLSDFTPLFGDDRGMMTHIGESSLPWDEFNTTSLRFLGCVSSISSKVWPSVVSGIQCLRDVKNPVDFSWLEKKNVSHQGPVSESVASGVCHSIIDEESRCIGCKCETEMRAEEDGGDLYRLAIHCLVYGGFLSTICYGYQSYWVDHIRELLCPERGRLQDWSWLVSQTLKRGDKN